jgi:hypothetical protein
MIGPFAALLPQPPSEERSFAHDPSALAATNAAGGDRQFARACTWKLVDLGGVYRLHDVSSGQNSTRPARRSRCRTSAAAHDGCPLPMRGIRLR